ADLFQRFGLGPGAIPDRDVMARFDQPLRHREAHAAHADPADFLCVLRGHWVLLCQAFPGRRCPSTGRGACNALEANRPSQRLVLGHPVALSLNAMTDLAEPGHIAATSVKADVGLARRI